MKRGKKIVMLAVIVITATMFSSMLTVKAGSNKIVKNQKSYLFAVPGGGWSTITVYVNYTEKQVRHNSDNKWWSREVYFSYKTKYATEKPYMQILNNIRHISDSGKTIHKFEKWTHCDSMADGSWDYFACYSNGKNMYYAQNTKNCASVSYLVFCNGGIITSGEPGYTLKMRLNTK